MTHREVRDSALAGVTDRPLGVAWMTEVSERATATTVRFTVLRGGAGAVVDGEPAALGGAQQRRLLAALLAERGTVVSADRLADTIWPGGSAPDGARRTVMTYVS